MNDTPYHSSVAGDFDESILGNEYHYYYTQLDDDDKLIYRQIYFAMDNAPSPVVLATSDGDKVSEIQQYVILDNPQFFHFSKGQYSVGSTLTFSEISEMSDSEIENAQRAIDNYTSAALSGIDGASSEYDKALHVYEYIIKNTDYVENATIDAEYIIVDESSMIDIIIFYKLFFQPAVFAFAPQAGRLFFCVYGVGFPE